MWALENVAPLIIELRKTALEARNKAGLTNPIKQKISLELKLFGSEKELEEMGDLDNLLSGVFDALQPKPNNPDLVPCKIFDLPEFIEISPEKAILFENDSNIYKIYAEKIVLKVEKYYTIFINFIE